MFLTSNMVPTGGNTKTTTLVVNGFSAAGSAPVAMISSGASGKEALSGALTSGVLKSMLSISGTAGSMSLCALKTNDATAQTLRIRVITDGAYTCFDAISSSVSAANLGIAAAGIFDSSTRINGGEEISWKTSIDVSIASSASATDKLVFVSKYTTEA